MAGAATLWPQAVMAASTRRRVVCFPTWAGTATVLVIACSHALGLDMRAARVNQPEQTKSSHHS